MTRDKVKTLQAAAMAALQAVAEAHGCEVKLAPASFGDSNAKLSFEFFEGGKSREVLDYERHASLLDLPALGSRFDLRREEVEIVGFRASARTAPIIIKRVRDGVLFVTSVEDAKRGCAARA